MLYNEELVSQALSEGDPVNSNDDAMTDNSRHSNL